MAEPVATPVPVLIVLGPGADATIIAHTHRVLNHFGIAFREINWQDYAALLAGDMAGLQVIIFATGIAYTDEHIALLENAIVPVLRFLTDPAPPPEHVVTKTAMMATMGFGVAGAVNAGLQAARILALSDAALRDLLTTKPYPLS